jgi:hypothetical protein
MSAIQGLTVANQYNLKTQTNIGILIIYKMYFLEEN